MRVKGGLRKARASGKQLGRPTSDIDTNKVIKSSTSRVTP